MEMWYTTQSNTVPILDIGDRIGMTGYIDFIRPSEVSFPIMKGIDNSNRPFVTLKANVYFDDGSIVKTFSTFFQRYSDNNHLWHCTGHYGKLLFDTGGGMTTQQSLILRELLTHGCVVINPENRDNLRILGSSFFDRFNEPSHDRDAFAMYIVLDD